MFSIQLINLQYLSPLTKAANVNFQSNFFTACIFYCAIILTKPQRENSLISHFAPDPPAGIQMRKLLRQPISTDKGTNFRLLFLPLISQRPLLQYKIQENQNERCNSTDWNGPAAREAIYIYIGRDWWFFFSHLARLDGYLFIVTPLGDAREGVGGSSGSTESNKLRQVVRRRWCGH